MKRYNPRSSVHHHIHYHRHLTSVLFLHVREYFQPSLNEVTIQPVGDQVIPQEPLEEA